MFYVRVEVAQIRASGIVIADFPERLVNNVRLDRCIHKVYVSS
jgi:hypothetical protein